MAVLKTVNERNERNDQEPMSLDSNAIRRVKKGDKKKKETQKRDTRSRSRSLTPKRSKRSRSKVRDIDDDDDEVTLNLGRADLNVNRAEFLEGDNIVQIEVS